MTTIKPGFVTVPGTTYDATNWEITSPVVLTSGVIWKGGKFTAASGAAFTSQGNCIDVKISKITCAPSIEWVLDAGMKPFIHYDGTDKTFVYKDVVIDGVNISGRTMLYNGPWEAMNTYNNVSFGVVIKNVIRQFDANSRNTLVFGHSVYKFRGSNWTLIGDAPTNAGDNGVVYINGNAQLDNIYRRGKQYGYIYRSVGAKLGSDPDQDVKVTNCVDSETVCYGTLDHKIDPATLLSSGAIPITACDAYFINNTSANKIDINNGYVTNAVVCGQTIDDLGKIFSVLITNSLAFGAWVSSMNNNSSLIKDNSSGKAKIVFTNNKDIPPGQPVPPGLVDADYYALTAIGAQRPAAPPVVVQRSAVRISILGSVANITYDDGSTSQLNIKNPINIS